MRQAGVIAAAALVGLEKMVDRLKDDHANARTIAEGLAKVPGISVDLPSVQTNIIIFDVGGLGIAATEFCAKLAKEGIKCSPRDTPTAVRMVTHRHIEAADARKVVETCRRLFERPASVRAA